VNACEEVTNGPIYGSLKAKLKTDVAEIFFGALPELCLTSKSFWIKRGSEGEHNCEITSKEGRELAGIGPPEPAWLAGAGSSDSVLSDLSL
jgi:hypothetical protein